MLDFLARQSKVTIWIGGFVAVGVVGFVDYVTPYEFSLTMFYFFLIFMVAWALGPRHALLFVALCLAVSWATNIEGYLSRDMRIYLWRMANRTVAFLFVAACGVAIRRYRDEVQARVVAMERARLLEQEIVRSGESEQRRIGQDLHDGVCQSLSAIDCATECLKRSLETEGGGVEHVASAERIQRMLREATVELRNLARSMSPINMANDGLNAAIESLVAMTNQLRQSSITFEADEGIQISDAAAALHLFRITQEALSNAMKHAKATKVTVTIKLKNGGLLLTVADNGRGFPAEHEESMGMGLHTMEYRAKLVGASLSIDRNQAGGVSVNCFLSLPMRSESGLRALDAAGLATAAT